MKRSAGSAQRTLAPVLRCATPHQAPCCSSKHSCGCDSAHLGEPCLQVLGLPLFSRPGAWPTLHPVSGLSLYTTPEGGRAELKRDTYLGRPWLSCLAGPGHSKGALGNAGLPRRPAASWTLCGLLPGHKERTGEGSGTMGEAVGRVVRQEKASSAARASREVGLPSQARVRGSPLPPHFPVTVKGTGRCDGHTHQVASL